jgi:hypothetical protein
MAPEETTSSWGKTSSTVTTIAMYVDLHLKTHPSVRKVVLTLTSKRVEQHYDTRFILVPVVGRTSSRGALVALYCKAP